MTEEIASTPGWVDDRLDLVFAALPQTDHVIRAKQAYAVCLAARKQPGAPSDTMGSEFNACRAALRRDLQGASVSFAALERDLEALEAEIAGGS